MRGERGTAVVWKGKSLSTKKKEEKREGGRGRSNKKIKRKERKKKVPRFSHQPSDGYNRFVIRDGHTYTAGQD